MSPTLKELKHKARVAALKREAVATRNAFYVMLNEADCGIATLKEINPRAARKAAEYNAAMEQLRVLDPDNFPDTYKPL